MSNQILTIKIGDVTPTRLKLLKEIIQALPNEKFHILERKEVLSNLQLPNCELLDLTDFVRGTYSNIRWENIPPIDVTTLRSMADYEIEFYSMIERYKFPNNIFIKDDQDYETKREFQINRYYKGELSFIEKQTLYHKHLRFWYWYLTKNNIKLIVYFDQAPHHGIDYIIYKIAHELKIKVIHYASGIVPKYRFFINDYKTNFEHEKYNIERIDTKREFSNPHFHEEYKRLTEQNYNEQRLPSYMYNKTIGVNNQKTKKTNLLKFISFDGFDYIFRLRKNRQFNHLLERFYKKNQQSPNYQDRYIYVPLHFQPEMTSSPLGYRFANQLFQIEYLSFCLPPNVKLFVKEHPKQELAFKGYHFYNSLIKINGVVLIPRNENTFKLIENSIAVSTLTGTAGWEGLFRNKPYIMFGDLIYKIIPGVFHVSSVESCKYAINKIIKGDYFIDREFLKKILLWSQDNSVYFDDNNNYENFLRAVIERMKVELSDVNKKK